MRLQKWSSDFKLEEDLPIASVWVLLLGLPYYLHTSHYVKQLVSIEGTPLEIAAATRSKTRPNMAKMGNCRLLERKKKNKANSAHNRDQEPIENSSTNESKALDKGKESDQTRKREGKIAKASRDGTDIKMNTKD
ncbi:hypothetical protein HAX54_017779 [Datura stramonium]|uniref:DUF4283 domain-containing protein n=1 Tax=Datura stramonium TaxID=4076 RepID=A0ABS8Y3D2_DATST|nr:hypothetical protein [Datura stramonium]